MTKIRKLAFPLNPEQKRAVETIEGPVMVIAGPGTGKTQTLTARIAHILQTTDTPPDGVLALTFTDAAAQEMRERLAKLIGPTAYYVNIQTFHSFCSDVIKSNPDMFPALGDNVEAISDLERVRVMQEILDSNDFSAVKPHAAPYLYMKGLTAAIADLKREGVSPNILRELVELQKPEAKTENKYHERNKELVDVYRMYQKELSRRKQYDFEDMINLVVAVFEKNPDFLLTYQQRFLYFLVDEYQDTNAAQNRLLMLLASYWKDQANVFVVGDDDQAIFRFQGASIENILSFHATYPNATVIVLKENYRSVQPFLDAVHAVIGHNKLSLGKKLSIDKETLTSQVPTPKETTVDIGRFSSGVTELFFIGKKIKELLTSGTEAKNIAVICRTNRETVDIADMLSRMKIPYDLERGGNVLDDPLIVRVLLLMKAVYNIRKKKDAEELFTILNYQFMKCDPTDVLKLTRTASDRKITLYDALLLAARKEIPVSDSNAFAHVVEILGELQRSESEGVFTSFFEHLINKTGLLDWCLSSKDAVNKLQLLNSLFSEIKHLNAADHQLNLESFLGAVELMNNQHIEVHEQDLGIQSNAVSIITAHRAKGREFDAVFITKAVDKKWGNNPPRDLLKLPDGILANTDIEKKEKNEDERRLFYVAMTRAKRYLFITSAKTYASSFGKKETSESMFVYEIPEQYIKHLDVSVYEQGVREILETTIARVVRKEHRQSQEEEAFLKTVLSTFKLSPTALNTYLACPYKFKINNLLRSPRAKAVPMSYGSAIHKALELFFKAYKQTRKLPELSLLHRWYEEAIIAEVLTDAETKRLLVRGKQVLTSYVEFYNEQLAMPFDIERFFGYGYSKTLLGSIPLGGKIDKIEPIDETGKTVRVVDYKTGRARSRNDIEGKTELSTGDYKRQLIFYRLLGDLDERFNATIVEAELDFVEPDKQTGKFKKERFVITHQELEELKQTIRNAWTDIVALKFPKTIAVKKHCDRCEWRFHCWPNGLPTENEQLSLLQ